MSDELKVTDRRWWARGEGDRPRRETPKLKPTIRRRPGSAGRREEPARSSSCWRSTAARRTNSTRRARGCARKLSKDVERGRRSMLVSFLEVLDNLDRALGRGVEPRRSVRAGRRRSSGSSSSPRSSRSASRASIRSARRSIRVSTRPSRRWPRRRRCPRERFAASSAPATSWATRCCGPRKWPCQPPEPFLRAGRTTRL